MRHPLLATQLYGVPLLLHPDKAAVIEAVFRSYSEGGQLALDSSIKQPEPQAVAYRAERYADKPYVVTEGGVAILPIVGTMVHRGSFLDAASGLTNYQTIERRAAAMAQDPDVKAILMEVDSPGGQAAGVFDLAREIAAIDKPVWAAVNEKALSAGYAIAAAADRIVMAETGVAGSIGVIALHVDQSKKNQKDGYSYTAVTAGEKKALGSPHAPLTDAARAEMQGFVDNLYDHFVNHVATARGIDAAAVRAQEAGLYDGQAAVDAGLVDALMSFNEALAALEAQVSAKPVSIAGFRQPTQGAAMSTQEATATQQSAEQVAAQLATARSDGAAEMQARVRDILTCDEAAGRAKLASHLAFSTAMGVDEAKALMAASAKEVEHVAATSQQNALAAGMAAVSNPNVGADAPNQEAGDQAQASALWARSNQKLHRVK